MRMMGVFFGIVLLVSTAACHSTQVKIPTASVGPNEKLLGPTEGSSTAVMILGLIPINHDERHLKAYNQAVTKAGGTRLTDVTISERWWWGYVVNGYNFKVQGTAVGNK